MNQHVTLPAPHLHDRWDDQVELEKSMLSMGRERVQSRINKAEEKRDMNRLRPYRSLLKEWVLPTSEGVADWIARAKKKRGVRPLALPRLEELSPDTAAMVALKTMLRHIGVRRPQILGLALEIGTWCEHEARCQKWMEEEPEDWRITAATYAKHGSNAAHQRRSRIALFNKYVWERIGWIAWTEQDRFRVGLELLNIVIERTNRFHLIPDPDWVPKRLKGGTFSKRPYILAADEELLQWLRSAMDDELVHAPVFLPTLIPPKPWEGPRDGGYWTPFVKTPFLIRFKAHHEETRNIALEEYEALDMPNVYRAVNIVQETPWAINKRVLEVANAVWDNDLAIAGLPSQTIEPIPERPEGAENPRTLRRHTMAKNTAETSISDTIKQALADDKPETTAAAPAQWGGFKIEVGVVPESARGGQTKYDWAAFPAPANPDDPSTWPSVYIADKAGAKSIYTSIKKYREKLQAEGVKPIPEFTVSVVKDPETKEIKGVRIIRRL